MLSSLVNFKSLLVLRVNSVIDLLCKVINSNIVGPSPVVAALVVVDGLGPGVGNLLPEVGFVVDLEAGNDLLDSGGELLGVEGDACHVVDFSLKLGAVCLEELYGGGDAVVDVDHGEGGLGSEPALVVVLLESVEEDLSRVVGRAVEVVLLTADHSGVPDRAEVHPKLVVVVGADVLIEHLADTVDRLRLKDGVDRGVHLGEVVAPEDRDR